MTRPITSMTINLIGAACLLAAAFAALYMPMPPLQRLMFLMAAYIVPVVGLEVIFLKVHRRALTDTQAPTHWARVGIKVAGFYATLAVLAYAYWFFKEYSRGGYTEFWQLVSALTPLVVGLSVPYILWVDRRMADPEDGLYHAGLAVLGRWSRLDRAKLKAHALGWLVKGFFLPLMLMMAVGASSSIVRFWPLIQNGTSPQQTFMFILQCIMLVDVVIATAGYLLTFRVLDSHIRSAEPTLAGWVAALMCYMPFWGFVQGVYLPAVDDGSSWMRAFEGSPFFWVWGGCILVLFTAFTLSTVVFGTRFSNLTHRGILTHGPYALTKHPAYVSKNIAWWMTNLPFWAAGWEAGVQATTFLLISNLVYFWRARTEERHLSADPAYVAYALAMNEKSLFAPLGRVFPFLRYVPPNGVATGRALP
jgi:hypothetical protein